MKFTIVNHGKSPFSYGKPTLNHHLYHGELLVITRLGSINSQTKIPPAQSLRKKSAEKTSDSARSHSFALGCFAAARLFGNKKGGILRQKNITKKYMEFEFAQKPWDLLGFIGIYWDLLGFIGIYWDWLGFIGI